MSMGWGPSLSKANSFNNRVYEIAHAEEFATLDRCPSDPRVKVEYLAGALYAEDHREEIARVAVDRREGETVQRAEGRVWAVMWQREPEPVRERYRVRAVGLLAWMGGGA